MDDEVARGAGNFMNLYIIPTIVMSVATIFVFLFSKKLHLRFPKIWLAPIMITPLILVISLLLFHIPYEHYQTDTRYLTDLLQPATAAFAIPLYLHRKTIKKYAIQLILSLSSGILIALVSNLGLAMLLGLQHTLVQSLAPRSITTPLAMDVSSMLGGVPIWTATFVIVTGVFGSVIGPWLANLLRLKSPIGKGTLLGMGAHGVGTATAFKIGEAEGTIASLSMVLAGCATILVAPWVVALVEHLF